MHELSVTQSILKICEEEKNKHNFKNILKINIKVGKLTGLVPECIEEYFKVISKETFAENAKMEVVKIPLKIKCNECEYVGVIGRNEYECPSCESKNFRITNGNEFYIDTLEVE